MEGFEAKDYFNDPERPGFLEWGLEVDRLLVATLTLGVLDLPDQDYSSMFADDVRPSAVVAMIIDEMGGF